jgi:hypothetical protein
MNTYSHVVQALARDAADRMDSLLQPRAERRIPVPEVLLAGAASVASQYTELG